MLAISVEGGAWAAERLATARLPHPVSGAPNMIVVVIDTLRADHLSCYGYARKTSPNLDRVAEKGVLFENAFSSSSWTLPSHASFLTGRYAYDHGAWRDALGKKHPTLGEVLQKSGYRTAAISANKLYFTRRQGFGRGFLHFEDYFHSFADSSMRTVYGSRFRKHILARLGFTNAPARKLAGDVNRSTLSWIARDRTRPFLILLNYFDLHGPYLPPRPYRARFSRHSDPGGIINPFSGPDFPKLSAEELQGEVDAYDGAIAYVDESIGRLLAELDRLQLMDNTIVVITSDHGESFGEHGLIEHANSLYMPEIRVPLIFWAPRLLPAGIRIQEPVSNAAVPATLMELLGTKQDLFPVPSLASLWNDGVATKGPWYALSEIAQTFYEGKPRSPSNRGWMKSLVTSRWHLIVHERMPEELYDWRMDSQELINLAGSPEGQAVVSMLSERLREPLASTRKKGQN
jgi:arylsulfatase A-like enzyme